MKEWVKTVFETVSDRSKCAVVYVFTMIISVWVTACCPKQHGFRLRTERREN